MVYNPDTVISPQYTPPRLTRPPNKEKTPKGPNILLGQSTTGIKKYGKWKT